MSTITTITGSVRLKDKTLSVDGAPLFIDKGDTLDGFMDLCYHALTIDYPRFHKMDRLSRAGFLAAEVLLSKYSLKSYSSSDVALILFNANGSFDTDKRYSEVSRSVPSPSLFVYTLPNIVAGEIAIRHKIKGECGFFVSGNFDSEWLSGYVKQVMLAPQVKSCVAGWVDLVDEHHDVLLYLVEKRETGLPHTAQQLNLLYF
jgi:hypothetical protein